MGTGHANGFASPLTAFEAVPQPTFITLTTETRIAAKLHDAHCKSSRRATVTHCGAHEWLLRSTALNDARGGNGPSVNAPKVIFTKTPHCCRSDPFACALVYEQSPRKNFDSR